MVILFFFRLDLASNKDDKQNKSETVQSKIKDDAFPSTSDANAADKKTNETNVLEVEKETEKPPTSATENIPLTDTTTEAAISSKEQEKKETKPTTPSKKQSTDESSKNVNSDSDDNLIDVEDPDDYLLYLEEILKKIHKRFYKFYEENKSVREDVTWLKKFNFIKKNFIYF